MLDFLIDNICVLLEGRVFQQTIDISMAMNCASLLADLHLHAYEADFLLFFFDLRILITPLVSLNYSYSK